MQNWSGEENEAMRGYILYAAKLLNGSSRQEYGADAITDSDLCGLFRYLYRATDDMTADEARNYYLNSDF